MVSRAAKARHHCVVPRHRFDPQHGGWVEPVGAPSSRTAHPNTLAAPATTLTADDIIYGQNWKAVYFQLDSRSRRTVRLARGWPDVAQTTLIAALALRGSRRHWRATLLAMSVLTAGCVTGALLAPGVAVPLLVVGTVGVANALRLGYREKRKADDYNREVIRRCGTRIDLDADLGPSHRSADEAREAARRRLPRAVTLAAATLLAIGIVANGVRILVEALR
jgi:hypothetical protein